MTTKENIRAWLIERAGNAYCASCITDAMNLFDLAQVRDSIRVLAAENNTRFHRFTAICFCCGKERRVICADKQRVVDRAIEKDPVGAAAEYLVSITFKGSLKPK